MGCWESVGLGVISMYYVNKDHLDNRNFLKVESNYFRVGFDLKIKMVADTDGNAVRRLEVGYGVSP